MLTDTWVTEEQIQVNTNSYLEGSNDLPLSLDIVQDFFCELDIKPYIHFLEISIVLLYHVIVRITKIMNNLRKDCKILTFKVIFSDTNQENLSDFFSMKLDTFLYKKVLSFKVKFSKNFNYTSWSPCLIFFTKKNQKDSTKNDFECQNFAIFPDVVHNYDRSDDFMIQWKNAYFQ